MLAKRSGKPIPKKGARKAPHCRTCGDPMSGHHLALCQLRSSSEDRSIFQDGSFPSTPPPTPTSSSQSIGSPRLSRVPHPTKPLSLEPSWEAPPDGTFYHRRNPYIDNPLKLSEVTPLQRTASWVSTEKADSEFGDRDNGNFSSTWKSEATSVARFRVPPHSASTLPRNIVTRNEPQVDVVDAEGNKVVGLDISTLSEQLKAIIRQADSAGYYATIVRPRIGYNRGSVDIRTKEDADKHTTVFVSTGPDTMSINLVCSEAFRLKAKLIAEGGPRWVSIFLATLLGSLISLWGSVIIIRTLG